MLNPHSSPTQQIFALNDTSTFQTVTEGAAATAPTLIIFMTRGAASYDTPRIVYLRKPDRIQYFANARWLDSPSQMLGSLAVRALERTGSFRAVVRAPTGAVGDLRLDVELIRLQHEFFGLPSRVRMTVRGVLFETATRHIVGSREFDVAVAAPSDDSAGGVFAANQATEQILSAVAAFCVRAVKP